MRCLFVFHYRRCAMRRVSIWVGFAFVGLAAVTIWIKFAYATDCTNKCTPNSVCQGQDSECYGGLLGSVCQTEGGSDCLFSANKNHYSDALTRFSEGGGGSPTSTYVVNCLLVYPCGHTQWYADTQCNPTGTACMEAYFTRCRYCGYYAGTWMTYNTCYPLNCDEGG